MLTTQNKEDKTEKHGVVVAKDQESAANKDVSVIDSGVWRWLLVIFTIVGIAFAVTQIFLIKPILENGYMYWLLGIFMPFVFILYPARPSAQKRRKPSLYDILLFVITLLMSCFFAYSAFEITHEGWAFIAPTHVSIMSLIYCFLTLEAVRRAGGTTLFVFTAIFAVYPLFAHVMPGILEGNSMPVMQVVRYHVLSTESLLGIPLQVVSTTIIGFMIFGVILAASGGGQFFLDLAFSILGTQPGGPAKVAVLSSGLFGSLSGSVISNIITTGSVTIPTMKRIGYPAHYAAAVEACASAGGCIMPPVMGAVAFVMASMLAIPYAEVAVAAFFPAFLYYLGIYVQVDSYARKTNLRGLPRLEIPKLITVLKEGYFYVFAILLMVFLLYLRKESQAPFYTSLILIVVAMMKKSTRFNLKTFVALFVSIGKVLAELIAILAACGFIIGAFSLTGVGSSLAREIVQLAGGNAFMMLVFGAVASFILGMGMTVTACYIFLAIILAPALVATGHFSTLAVYMFILYWGIVSFITPPVALGSYTAAGIAGAAPFQTGLTSMRLGMVKYIVPFFFVYNPALIFHGTVMESVIYCGLASLGIIILAGAFEGYLYWYGKLSLWGRLFLCVAGFLVAMPNDMATVIGAVILIAYTVAVVIQRRRAER